jgi:hypothetical protein
MGMEMAHETEPAFKITPAGKELMRIVNITMLLKCVSKAVGSSVKDIEGEANDGRLNTLSLTLHPPSWRRHENVSSATHSWGSKGTIPKTLPRLIWLELSTCSLPA